jgi:carboxypeptidase C (cathepsin A)
MAKKKRKPSTGGRVPAPKLEPQRATTSAEGSFGGHTVAYTTTAATQVFDVAGKQAAFFHVAYTRDDADPAERPILFCFNGGPGSSTVWLNLGLFGPRRMVFDDDGFKVGMQGRLVDNDDSVLDVTDVVCIDAMGTGFSRTADRDHESSFHHFRTDIEAFSHFIVHYLNRNGRWASPKYLAGESYGTLRAAGVARDLYDHHHVELNGIVLISTVLNDQTSAIDATTMLVHPGNDLPFPLLLPTFAAVAHHHGRGAESHRDLPVRDLLDEVEAWSLGEYWPALAQGDRLDPDRRATVVERLAAYTGIEEEIVDRSDLRIQVVQFCRELLADEQRTVGRLDGRYTGIDRLGASNSLEADPSGDATRGVAASALNQFLRDEVGFVSDEIYTVLSLDMWKTWNYEEFAGRYVDTSADLGSLLTRSRATRVFVASGYYDLATPHFATDYTMAHLGLDPGVRGNVHTEYYEAGHMMYLHRPSRERLAGQLRSFIDESR